MAESKYRAWTEGFEIIVGIEDSENAKRWLKEINDFWSGAEKRVEETGSLEAAVVSLLFDAARYAALQSGFGLYDPVKQLSNVEGWPPPDGDCGIRIVDWSPDVDLDEPTIEKLKLEEVTP
jgi:hypothetical protein